MTALIPTTGEGRRLEPLALDLDAAELDALTDVLAGQLSKNTERAYRTDLRRFMEWVSQEPRPDGPLALDRALVVRYRAHLAAVYAPATVNRRLTCLRVLCSELVERGVLDRNPLTRLRGMRLPNESPLVTLTQQQTSMLLDACRADPTPRGLRDLAIIQLGLWNGLRKAELLSVRWDSLHERQGHLVLAFVAKGNVERDTKIHPAMLRTLTAWGDALRRSSESTPDLTIFRPILGPRSPRPEGDWPWTAPARPLGRTALDKLVAKRALQAGLPRITPHSLRSSHITICRQLGAPTHLIQYNVGHADARTTNRYDARRRALDHHATDYMGYLGSEQPGTLDNAPTGGAFSDPSMPEDVSL